MVRNISTFAILLVTATGASADWLGTNHGVVAPSATGPAVWTGSIVVKGTTAACTSNVPVGTIYESNFRPKLKAGEPNSGLSIFFPVRIGALLQTTNANSMMRGAGNYNASVISGVVTPVTTNGTYNFAITPATINSATKFIQISGVIGAFGGIPGCTVTILASYSLYRN